MSKIEYDRVVDVFDSDSVDTVAFSMKSFVMKVRFKTTAEYVYYNVSPKLFASIVAAESVGKTLYTLVSSDPSNYPYEAL